MSAVVFIPLTRGKVAVIDFEDWEKVRPYKWRASKNGPCWYVKTTTGKRDIYLHRFLLGVSTSSTLVDHRDRDGLNNRRYNLRACSSEQNVRHQGLKPANTTGFKGVSFRRDCQKWVAHIRHSGKKHHIGIFKTPVDAARAYDAEARKHHKDFAFCNFQA